MTIDYIRVYQDPDFSNVGCDPADFPTQAYINECVRVLFSDEPGTDTLLSFFCPRYEEAYHNPNLTTWVSIVLQVTECVCSFLFVQVNDYKQITPRNSLVDGGC